MAAGKAGSTPVAVVASASLPQAHTQFGSLKNLARLARAIGSEPAIILIGEAYAEVAALRPRALRVFERKASQAA